MISSSAIHCLSRPARSSRVPAGLFRRAGLVFGGGLASNFRRYSTASAALVCDAIVGFENPRDASGQRQLVLAVHNQVILHAWVLRRRHGALKSSRTAVPELCQDSIHWSC